MLEMAVHYSEMVQTQEVSTSMEKRRQTVTDYLVDVVANPNFINDADGAGLAGLRDGSVNAVFSGTWNAEAVKRSTW